MNNRFWGKINKIKSGCWEWTGSKSGKGYGLLRLNVGEKLQYAHRVSWEIHNGKIYNSLFVLHSCDNPPCVNPRHLFLGTQKDNIQDAIRKGRFACGEKQKHKITESQVKTIRGLYKKGGITQIKIGKIFGLGQGHISRIISNSRRKYA